MILIIANSCEKETQCESAKICTLQAVSGLIVNVRLQNSNDLETTNVTVTIKEGAYTENLVANPPYQLAFTGAVERKGNYIITVTKPGFKTFTSGTIKVEADCCHVIPKVVEVVLQPIAN